MSSNKTPNYNLHSWEGTDLIKREEFNENFAIIDNALKPTADPSQVPNGNVGKIAQWVSWLTNRIKVITGKPNWWDAPDITLADTKSHIDADAPHVGHETPSGAQDKANAAAGAALTAANNYTDQKVESIEQGLALVGQGLADLEQDHATHLADDNPHGLVLPANSKNNNAAVADFPNGISHMYANQAGLGFPVQYAHIITFRNGNTGYQLACSTTASSEIYMRSSSGGVFGTWKQIPSYDDPRFSDSRKCNNTFDDAATARNNLGVRKITSGTAAPSGGSNGDIYFQR